MMIIIQIHTSLRFIIFSYLPIIKLASNSNNILGHPMDIPVQKRKLNTFVTVKAPIPQHTDGFNSLTNLEYFYEYAIFRTLIFITLLQLRLYFYGKNLDKKFSQTIISQIIPAPNQENPPTSGKNQTLSWQLQSLQELNGADTQKGEIQSQKNLNQFGDGIERKQQIFLNNQTTLKIKKNVSEQIEVLRLDNQIQIESQSNQLHESLKSFINPSQFLQLGQSQQLQDLEQLQLQDEKFNQIQQNTIQQEKKNQINSNKVTVKTFHDQSSIINLVNKDIKLSEYELQSNQQFQKLSLLLKFKVFHSLLQYNLYL
ncbi:hypothetical protein ABPG74_022701 [Tetrahymena malaccensis]